MHSVPAIRIRQANGQTINARGDYVLYWMIANRRVNWNFALDRAVDHARELKKPLVILEALRVGYPWASDRLHRFVLQGMADNQQALARRPVLYYPYVEPKQGAGHGLLERLADDACLVVTDEFPCFFLPRMVNAAAGRLKVRCEVVDSCGLLPLRAAENDFPTAYAFRRFLQRVLPEHLPHVPRADPFAGVKLPAPHQLAASMTRNWPKASADLLAAKEAALRQLPIDHAVGPASQDGGGVAAERLTSHFLRKLLADYPERRNEPAAHATSGLSPYLHFGHVSSHEVFHRLAEQEAWLAESLPGLATGKRPGWWGMSDAAEAFLDQLITWRELGYNFCTFREDYDRYDSLPDWAKKTLAKHRRDRRRTIYSDMEFETARTHDRLWNAAQRQLVVEGQMHNYVRMLWGKKILEWSETPEEALATMVKLNNKYALDGRDPNSYSGIFWILGRFDRAWGPERPIFGTVRYMSSDNTARKFDVKPYLEKYAPERDTEESDGTARTTHVHRLSKRK
ncbi:MAG TPA: deoxyribodipyrimidine photolyase [Pirellulales bacterium]|nr:deoxyribodipyrimidine photolyase [Pirellulales bacterium]